MNHIITSGSLLSSPSRGLCLCLGSTAASIPKFLSLCTTTVGLLSPCDFQIEQSPPIGLLSPRALSHQSSVCLSLHHQSPPRASINLLHARVLPESATDVKGVTPPATQPSPELHTRQTSINWTRRRIGRHLLRIGFLFITSINILNQLGW